MGYDYHGMFNNGVVQIPSITGWGGEFATLINPGGFEIGGTKGFYYDNWMPSISDVLTKAWGTHTIKLGSFWEWTRSSQPDFGYTNQTLVFSSWGTNTTGSAYGDLMTGRVTNDQEQNKNRLFDTTYTSVEGFAQDSWRVNRKLTLELRLRVSHFTPWTDRQGFGYAEFVPALYNPAETNPLNYPGFTWHARDPRIPNGIFPARAAFWSPRFGLAYDISGKGHTVLRGDWGRFYCHPNLYDTGLQVSGGELSANLTARGTSSSTPTRPARASTSTTSPSWARHRSS